MGYGGQTANGLSSLGPKMGKASGGGVKLEQGMGKISESQDDVLSGKETQMENDSMAKAGVIAGSHSIGKFMATPRYKSHGTSKAKPDFPDVDGDGNTTESIKSASASITKYVGDKKKVKKVNEIGDRTRKDTYAYRKPEAKVLKN